MHDITDTQHLSTFVKELKKKIFMPLTCPLENFQICCADLLQVGGSEELQNLFDPIVSGSLALDCCTLRWTTE